MKTQAVIVVMNRDPEDEATYVTTARFTAKQGKKISKKKLAKMERDFAFMNHTLCLRTGLEPLSILSLRY